MLFPKSYFCYMKQFNVPPKFQSSIIKKIKAKQLALDPRKQDFSPFEIHLDKVSFIFPRHFGFCYGVENAIEVAYKATTQNPNKKVYLLSELIHNATVNQDLADLGIQFVFNDLGEQKIAWEDIAKEGIVITPAFGTTKAIENKIKAIGIDALEYNSTCPFVEKVWKKASILSQDEHTIIVHGKHEHQETKATFSQIEGKAVIVRNIHEAKVLGDIILGNLPSTAFYQTFEGKYSDGFDSEKDLIKIGVVNQTTMLASETQEIAEYFKTILVKKHGAQKIKKHFADTRDTLCYATNNNQKANLALLNQEADLAFVIGGYNSSNTKHLFEIIHKSQPTFYIQSVKNIQSASEIIFYDFSQQKEQIFQNFLLNKNKLRIIISSGASCPDIVVDQVIERLLDILKIDRLALDNAI